jgi:hypothetical protein
MLANLEPVLDFLQLIGCHAFRERRIGWPVPPGNNADAVGSETGKVALATVAKRYTFHFIQVAESSLEREVLLIILGAEIAGRTCKSGFFSLITRHGVQNHHGTARKHAAPLDASDFVV